MSATAYTVDTTGQVVAYGIAGQQPTPNHVRIDTAGNILVGDSAADAVFPIASTDDQYTVDLVGSDQLFVKAASGTVDIVVHETLEYTRPDEYTIEDLLEIIEGSGGSYYDARNITADTDQSLPNRVFRNTQTTLQRGSTSTSDTNDPLFLAHTGEHYVRLPGSASNFLSVPDAAALDITSDLDLRAEVALDDYASGSDQVLVSKNDAGSQRSYILHVSSTGFVVMTWSTTGSDHVVRTSTAAITTKVADGGRIWVRATLDVDNGASGHDVNFYTSTDGSTWTQLGTTVTTASTTSVFASTAPARVGLYTTSSFPATGKFYRAQIYSGIDGTKVLDIWPDRDINAASDVDAGQSSFTATTGQTVTVSRGTTGVLTVVVTRPVWVGDATDDYMQGALADVPGITKAAGSFTTGVLVRSWVNNAFARAWSAESASNNGASIQQGTTDFFCYTGAGGSDHVNATRSYTLGQMRLVSAIFGEGSLYLYLDGQGRSSAVALSGITGTPTFNSTGTRLGSRADSVSGVAKMEFFAHFTVPNVEFSEDNLDTLNTYLKTGDFLE
jgi:hypothetical protein